MIKHLKNTKTIICIGSGGVGKTTLAATLAIGKANEGLRVLVLTIDPSLRLAQALGIQNDGQVYDITTNDIKKNKGHLSACVIHHEKAFQEFIAKASAEKLAVADIKKLTNNKLYQQLSTKLSGSQEFTSLFKLNQFVKSENFDLVILDTPPAQHTWQFLKAPQKLAELFNEGVASWFRDPQNKDIGFFKKILNVGTTQILKALEVLTGAEFIKELSLFFSAIKNWQEPLETEVMDCHRLLTSENTEFFLVTAMEPARIFESQKICNEIYTEGYRLTSLIINKVPTCFKVYQKTDSEKINNVQKYYKDIENQLYNISEDVFNKKILIYKCPQVNHNDLQVKKLSEVYSEITAHKSKPIFESETP